MIQQRQLNPDQPIFAFISLSYEIRSELWHEDAKTSKPVESNFKTHVFTKKDNWRTLLLNNEDIGFSKKNNEFHNKYSTGRAYYYSPYAERINLMCDLVMFQSLMAQLNVKFLMFQGPVAEQLEQEYLLDFFKLQLSNKNFLDFEKFGFTNWCFDRGFEPLDFKTRPTVGHYGADAHKAFAEQVLIPTITKL
jgi:hypothetical protein